MANKLSFFKSRYLTHLLLFCFSPIIYLSNKSGSRLLSCSSSQPTLCWPHPCDVLCLLLCALHFLWMAPGSRSLGDGQVTCASCQRTQHPQSQHLLPKSHTWATDLNNSSLSLPVSSSKGSESISTQRVESMWGTQNSKSEPTGAPIGRLFKQLPSFHPVSGVQVIWFSFSPHPCWLF